MDEYGDVETRTSIIFHLFQERFSLVSLRLWLSASTRPGWPELPQQSFAAAQGYLAVLVCQEVVENVESGRAGGFSQWSGGT